jgi:hypothetical protein
MTCSPGYGYGLNEPEWLHQRWPGGSIVLRQRPLLRCSVERSFSFKPAVQALITEGIRVIIVGPTPCAPQSSRFLAGKKELMVQGETPLSRRPRIFPESSKRPNAIRSDRRISQLIRSTKTPR